uniref:Uncharacterized protein n=1 Tax=Panagrolaimus davidi TaxID=227884 RepID=A0A914QJ27_9BILA
MSNTPMIPNFGTSTSNRKRKFASVEERVPTPYPKNDPKFHKKLFIEKHSTTSPSESKKAVNIDTNEFEIPHLKKEDSKDETEIEKETTNDKNDGIENLKNEINGIIDRMLNQMITNIENLRKNILFEINETFGCENTVESFDEIELQTDDDGGEGIDGKCNKFNAKTKDNPEGMYADSELKTGDKEESNNEMDSQTTIDEKEVDPKNSNSLNINDLSFEA